MRLLKLWANRLWEAIKRHRVVFVMTLAFIVWGCVCTSFGYILHGWELQHDLSFWEKLATTLEPEHCVLCEFKDEEVRHAPVLVDLSTGAIGEMRVNDSSWSGEVSDVATTQNGGTFGFVLCAGLAGWRDTATNTLQVTLLEENNLMNPSLFCHECRAILANTSSTGYVILDLFDIAAIKAYKIEETSFMMRNYEVSVLQDENSRGLTISVKVQKNI